LHNAGNNTNPTWSDLARAQIFKLTEKGCKMDDIERRLRDMGVKLPGAASPAANYVPYVMAGDMLHISGQLPMEDGAIAISGKLGENVSLREGQRAARLCAINILAQARAAIDGEWPRLERLVRLGGFVNCAPSFLEHPAIINGASDFLVEAMGENGRHARFAVGAASLPFDAAVEIDAVFLLKG
jgi:enamine deaminase RidA (YjgF/YER057c/UK114 family)